MEEVEKRRTSEGGEMMKRRCQSRVARGEESVDEVGRCA
jgi:hypothetical protein